MNGDKTINTTIGRIVWAAFGVAFTGFFITLLSRGESAGFLIESLFRIPVFHYMRPMEFANCDELVKRDARTLWKVRIHSAARVMDPLDFKCYALDADNMHSKLPEHISAHIVQNVGGSEAVFWMIAGSQRKILLTACGKERLAINVPISGIAKSYVGNDTGVAMVLDNSHETPLLYPTVILFWCFAVPGIVLLVSRIRHRGGARRSRSLMAEAEILRIIIFWADGGEITEDGFDLFCDLALLVNPIRIEIMMTRLPDTALVDIIRRNGPVPTAVIAAAVSIAGTRMKKKSLPHLRDLFRRLDDDGSFIRESIELYRSDIESATAKGIKLKILRLFASLADRRQASFLLGLLDCADADIVIGAVRALGACGTVKDIEGIYRLGEASHDADLRAAVREAIDAIQERLGKVDAGWLSLPDENSLDGALSTPEIDRAGGLSDTEKNSKKKK